jgi:hypothetical protein
VRTKLQISLQISPEGRSGGAEGRSGCRFRGWRTGAEHGSEEPAQRHIRFTRHILDDWLTEQAKF